MKEQPAAVPQATATSSTGKKFVDHKRPLRMNQIQINTHLCEPVFLDRDFDPLCRGVRKDCILYPSLLSKYTLRSQVERV